MEIARYRYWLTLAVTLVVFTVNAYCQDKPIDTTAPVCQIISLPYLAGEIALSFGDQKVIEKMMPCFLKLWAAQLPSAGKENAQLSNIFLFAMGENPQSFFSVMAKEPDAFSQWLSEFPKLSFSSINSASCALEDKRKRLIDVLQKAHISGTKEQEFNKAVLSKLLGMPTSKGCG